MHHGLETTNSVYPHTLQLHLQFCHLHVNMTSTAQTQPLTLAGKVAIVTGGARGIGAATAIELAKRGANVRKLPQIQGKS